MRAGMYSEHSAAEKDAVRCPGPATMKKQMIEIRAMVSLFFFVAPVKPSPVLHD